MENKIITAFTLTSKVEQERKFLNRKISRQDRSKVGQFFTPAPIANFMASLFQQHKEPVRILDAGAGIGGLFVALVTRLCSHEKPAKSIEVITYENDVNLQTRLSDTIELCRGICAENGIDFRGTALMEDFISAAGAEIDEGLFRKNSIHFTHVIMNPPYKKINGETDTRRFLNALGLEISNLYAAFVWLAVRMLEHGGELVAIIPRSFCNGPYFRRFRKALLKLLNLQRIHIFKSRKKAFSDDNVLQENIIIYGIREERQSEEVIISTSDGLDFDKLVMRNIPFSQVVKASDIDSFIHLPENDKYNSTVEKMSYFTTTLEELGIEVSTGRVVDFRARENLRKNPQQGTVPLIYPCHFKNGFVSWPITKSKKPNAIIESPDTRELLVPSGYYVLTKRFSSKEEKRRIVAAIFDPRQIDAPYIGFENHLNYFHIGEKGLSKSLAQGLALFLNSSIFDQNFRLFSGHTQVNATDLRKMRYPSRDQLLRLGEKYEIKMPNQETIDDIIERECEKNGKENKSCE